MINLIENINPFGRTEFIPQNTHLHWGIGKEFKPDIIDRIIYWFKETPPPKHIVFYPLYDTKMEASAVMGGTLLGGALSTNTDLNEIKIKEGERYRAVWLWDGHSEDLIHTQSGSDWNSSS